MYLYKATCDIPKPKTKAPERAPDRAPAGTQTQGSQGRPRRRAPAGGGPVMLWTRVRANGLVELKQLEEFLHCHALSLQETVRGQTGMAYSSAATNWSLEREPGFGCRCFDFLPAGPVPRVVGRGIVMWSGCSGGGPGLGLIL
ncbi:unnamed protein product [Boreogadus saida]